MRAFSTTLRNHLDARTGLISDLLVWATGINRSTQALETQGFWTGPTDQTITVDGSPRDYAGAGALIQVPPMVSEVGLSVRTTRLMLSPVHPDVAAALEAYELRLQPIEMHVAYSTGVSGNLVDAPVRVFSGLIAGQPRNAGPPGEAVTLELTLLSASVYLTRTLHLRKSDRALQARHPGDRFRRFADVSGVVETVWGDGKARAPFNANPPQAKPASQSGGNSGGHPYGR